MPMIKLGQPIRLGSDFYEASSFVMQSDGTFLSFGPAGGAAPGTMDVVHYDRDGTILSSRQVQKGEAFKAGLVDTAVLANGNIVTLSWTGWELSYRVFNSDGEALTNHIAVPNVEGGSPTHMSWFALAPNLAKGGFSVLVGADNSFSERTAVISDAAFGERKSHSDVRIVEFDNNGKTVHDPYFANYDKSNPLSWTDNQFSAGHATLNDGRVVAPYYDMVYQEAYPANPALIEGGSISVAILKDGQQQNEVSVHVPTWGKTAPGRTDENFLFQARANHPPVAVATSDGGFAVIYMRNIGNFFEAEREWFVQFFNSAGAKVGAAHSLAEIVGPGGTESGFAPVAAALPDGRIALVTSYAASLNAREIMLTILGSDGTASTTAVTSFGTGQGISGVVDVVVGADGSIFVATTDREIHRFVDTDMALQAPSKGGTVNGTTGDDLILGSAHADVLRGDKGSDQIEGNSGNDRIEGGDDDDFLYGGDGNDVLVGGKGTDRLVGGAGKDTASYEDAKKGIAANLKNPKKNKGDAAGDTYDGIENLTGSKKADKLTGDDGNNIIEGLGGKDTLKGGGGKDTLKGGGGKDKLKGGAGKDKLKGGGGKDKLTGGKGADQFVFKSLKDSPDEKTGWDVITDFSHGQNDRINLKAIDARAGTKKNDKFTFIGDEDFSGKKGELRYEKKDKQTFVYGDVDGDGKADFAIALTGKIDLVKSDFML